MLSTSAREFDLAALPTLAIIPLRCLASGAGRSKTPADGDSCHQVREPQRRSADCNSRRQASLKSCNGSISLIRSGRSTNVLFGDR
jgi:hypothetical protein